MTADTLAGSIAIPSPVATLNLGDKKVTVFYEKGVQLSVTSRGREMVEKGNVSFSCFLKVFIM